MTQAPHLESGERLGLIAGNGRFPIIFADNARKLGYHVSAVAHEGETDPELANHVDCIHWIKIGQLNKLIKAFKDDQVHQAVMLGGIKKTHVFTTVRPDFRALALAARLALWKDDDILREIAKELEKEGTPREALQLIHAPMGLAIGAVTPEEIAISVVAEMIAVRRNAASDWRALSMSVNTAEPTVTR